MTGDTMTGWEELVEEGTARREVPLAAHTTYKLGGPAGLFVEAETDWHLDRTGAALRSAPRPFLVMGRGSNLLISDDGFPGVVVVLGASFRRIETGDDGIVTAGAAAPLPRIARTASAAGRGGLEWCVGVPGSAGGAVRQNAGCFGTEVVDRLVDAEVMDLTTGSRRVFAPSDLGLGYRHSNLAPTDVVVRARFATEEVDPEVASAEMRRVTRWRRDHQPGGTLNAGSVFKNPPDQPAAAVVDQLGLKGFALEGVRVSPRHANFIEAEANATAAAVRRLILEVQQKVADATGIVLEPEIQFVGFED